MIVLTQSEADELLSVLKACVEKVVDIPVQGKSEDVNVVSELNKSDKFIITLNRISTRTNKITFNARYKTGDIVILRLDVNGPPHTNPDGTKVCGTHLHIYKEGHSVKYAIPYDITNPEFDNLFYEFLDRFNVIDKPTVKMQQEMEEI